MIQKTMCLFVLILMTFFIGGCQSSKQDSKSLNVQESEGKIVFVSYRDGNPEIYTMNADGTQQVRLTHNEASDTEPSWSPDGEQIVFQSHRDGNSELYMMNFDGSDLTRLTSTLEGAEGNPEWSPNGDYIAFDILEEGLNRIKILHIETGEIKQIVGEKHNATEPSWSMDGQSILFISRQDHKNVYQNELYTISLVDNVVNGLSDVEERNTFMEPVLSPDGQRVIFSTLRDPKVHILDVNSLEITPLVMYYKNDLIDISDRFQAYPSWSPDGSKIVFSLGDTTSGADIFILNLESRQLTQLTEDPAIDLAPDWWVPDD